MSQIRIIPRLDIKGPNVVKGIHLEGLRVIGNPNDLAIQYYHDGADELIFIDIVASLYNRNNLSDIISLAAKDVFIPITVGGGIRTIDDAACLFRMGADKVAINTAAIKTPKLLQDISDRFGAQSVVLSVEAKAKEGGWEAYTDNGREKTGLEVISWVLQAQDLGIGEILLTSVDQEGTRRGLDISLIKEVSAISNVPLVVCGGIWEMDHLSPIQAMPEVDAVAMSSVFHYKEKTIQNVKNFLEREVLVDV